MVVTVRSSFDSSKSFGVGFGAKPMPRTDKKSSFRTANPANRIIKQPEPRPTVATTTISRGKPSSVGITKRGGKDKVKVGAATKGPVAPTNSSPREPLTQSTGGFNKIVLNHQLYTNNNKLSWTKSLQGTPPSPNRRAIKKQRVDNRKPTAVEKAIATASVHISRSASQLMEELEERRRQETSKERIAHCLVNLRAASERSVRLQEYQSERSHRTEPSLRDVVGDMGVALFNPIDFDVFLSKESMEPLTDDESEEEEIYPIDMVVESPSALSSCPRLLSPAMMEQLVDALPSTVKTMTWKRLFALGRDGDSFCTMLERVRHFNNTIIVVETTHGHILGGYAASPWVTQGGMTRTFYGSGKSFLFATHPDGIERSAEDEAEDKLHIFNWTGHNLYCQVCDVDEGQLAMGGGGAFGLIVEDDFSRGTSGRCSTFGNPALVPDTGGYFEVVAFEVYGFSSMAEVFSQSIKI